MKEKMFREKMEKLILWRSKTGRTNLIFNLELKVFEVHWAYQTWEEEESDMSEEFDGLISALITSEIKEAEKQLKLYHDKCGFNNDYPVYYYENTDKIG